MVLWVFSAVVSVKFLSYYGNSLLFLMGEMDESSERRLPSSYSSPLTYLLTFLLPPWLISSATAACFNYRELKLSLPLIIVADCDTLLLFLLVLPTEDYLNLLIECLDDKSDAALRLYWGGLLSEDFGCKGVLVVPLFPVALSLGERIIPPEDYLWGSTELLAFIYCYY